MSTPMFDVPEHLGMPINANGQGPADPEETVGWACWCPDPDCDKWAVEGVCDLCGQELILTVDDCWHPWSVERPCPPEPNTSPNYDHEGWQEFFAAGKRSGRPGREHWREIRRG